jgi:hypothetical protein
LIDNQLEKPPESKRQTPQKGFALIEKRYHNYLRPFSDSRYIAEIQ